MKFCQPHWQEIRAAVEIRGLMHLVSKNGQELIKREVAALWGVADEKRDYDPLASVTWSLYQRALEQGGMYLMGQDENGNEFCPLCELDKYAKNNDGSTPDPKASTQWIDRCCNAQLEYCQEAGLVAHAC